MGLKWEIFPGSEVMISNSGSVKRFDGLSYKYQKKHDGYFIVSFKVNNKRKTFCIHRLVALLFVKNLYSKPEVNHIDGDKSNNHESNLEWCTHAENIKHAWDNGLLKSTQIRSDKIRLKCSNMGPQNHQSKKVIGFTIDGHKTKVYDCMRDASKSHNTDFSQVSRSANKILTKNNTQRAAGKLNNKPLYWEFV